MALIEKKELKIKETQRVLDEDVQPQFLQLTEDKRNFDKYNE